MKLRISILVAAFCLQGLEHEAHAGPTSSANSVQFYLGFAGGLEHMSGKRSESLDEEDPDNSPASIITIYTKNRSMKDDNITLSAMAGFLWQVSNLPIMIGPELYVGRGSTISSFNDTRKDTANLNRFYKTDFQRKAFWGGLARVGYNFYKDYLAYLSGGYEGGQFSIASVITNDPENVTTTQTHHTKWFNGFSYGLGVEKRMACFKVGVDLRAVQYGRKTFVNSMNVNATNGVLPASFRISLRPIIYTGALRISYLF